MINLSNLIKDKNVWIKDSDNVYYLTKFNSSNLNLFYIDNIWYASTDDRYFARAKKELKDFIVLNDKDRPFSNFLVEKITKKDQRLFIDFNFLTAKEQKYLNKNFPDIKIEDLDLSKIRMIKSDNEIEKIQEACKITDQIFNQIVKFIKPGLSEKIIEKKLKELIINSNADGWSFEPIVAAGKNAANPHYQARDYILKANDMMTIDFGVYYQKYASDMTRTFAVEGQVSKEAEKIHDLTLKAAELAIKEAKAGVKISKLDQIVRDFLKKAGYEEYFIHSLGHGLGINVHEAPGVSGFNHEYLEKNMIITIEPGIYLNDLCGCRIEQDILIRENDCLELNKSPKNLYLNDKKI